MVSIIKEKLECFSDLKFQFDPKQHRYTYEGDTFISVTQFISTFHKVFDEDKWSKKKAEELGVEQQEILLEWKRLNDYSNEIGTYTHQWIEDYFNGIFNPIPTNLDIVNRINKFNLIYAKHLHKLEPVKFETRIFSKKWKIAGTIDALFLFRGKLYIVDWKTNKKFLTDENLVYKEPLLPPFQDFYKHHLNEYSIQISLYALILKEWGFDVAGGYLVHIGPDEQEPKMYTCKDFTGILEKFLNSGEIK